MHFYLNLIFDFFCVLLAFERSIFSLRSQAHNEHLFHPVLQNSMQNSDSVQIALFFSVFVAKPSKNPDIVKIKQWQFQTHKYVDQIGYDSILCWPAHQHPYYFLLGLCIFVYAFLPRAVSYSMRLHFLTVRICILCVLRFELKNPFNILCSTC